MLVWYFMAFCSFPGTIVFPVWEEDVLWNTFTFNVWTTPSFSVIFSSGSVKDGCLSSDCPLTAFQLTPDRVPSKAYLERNQAPFTSSIVSSWLQAVCKDRKNTADFLSNLPPLLPSLSHARCSRGGRCMEFRRPWRPLLEIMNTACRTVPLSFRKHFPCFP